MTRPTAYPGFLPERLRSLIAGQVGVRDEQVVIGGGATGVILQVLHAVTSPGEKMVMTSPTFDGYPIFAQMARLESMTVALDAHGHHDLDAMAEAAARRPRGRGVPTAQPDRHRRARSTIERFLRQDSGRTPWCCWTRPMWSSCPLSTGSMGLRSLERYPECRGAADLLEGIRAGRAADRLRLLRPDAGSPVVDHAAAVRHRHHQPGGGRGLV